MSNVTTESATTQSISRAEYCAVACAEIFAGAGEIFASPMTPMATIGARLARLTTEPDLLITDINMPRLDGFGLIERVRESVANVVDDWGIEVTRAEILDVNLDDATRACEAVDRGVGQMLDALDLAGGAAVIIADVELVLGVLVAAHPARIAVRAAGGPAKRRDTPRRVDPRLGCGA